MLGFELRDKERKMLRQVPTRLACMQACLAEKEFECRSVNFDPDNGDCSLSDMDRGSIVPTHDLKMRTYGPSSSGSLEYIENNCIEGKFFPQFFSNAKRVRLASKIFHRMSLYCESEIFFFHESSPETLL